MKVSCTISGGLVITFISSVLVKVDFFVFNIVPLTWLNDNGTRVSGYDRSSAISTLCSSERNKILPNKFLVRHAEIILPSPTFNVFSSSFCSKQVYGLMLYNLLNLVGSSMHSKINSFLSSAPIFDVFNKNSSVFCETDLPVAMLNNRQH